MVDDKLLFSKKELGRFPESEEAEKLIREAL
jgi:predicted Rdx family selenoprotein